MGLEFINCMKKQGNPNPVQTQKFKEQMFRANSDLPPEPLAKRDTCVKLGQSVYEYLQQLPQCDRINLVRQAITAAAKQHQLLAKAVR
jgi:hypothetical protein